MGKTIVIITSVAALGLFIVAVYISNGLAGLH